MLCLGAFVATGLLMNVPAANAAVSRYVAPDGEDSSARDGGATQPWKTIKYALSRVPNDCQLIVYGSGNPADPYVLKETAQTVLEKTDVTIVAPNRDVRIDGALVTANEFVFSLRGTRNTVKGLQFVNGGGSTNSCRGGIGFGGLDCAIDSCEIFNNPAGGVFGWEARRGRIRGCNVYNNGFLGKAPPGDITHGVYLSSDCDSCVIEDNLFRGNAEQGLHINGGTGAINSGVVVRRNIFDRNEDGFQGMDFMDTHDSWCYANLFIENTITLCSNPDTDPSNSARNVICNNTFVAYDMSVVVRMPQGSFAGAIDNVIFNNVFATRLAASAVSSDGINTSVDHNVFLNSSATNLSALFENYSADDYRIKPGSAADDAGVLSFAGRDAPARDITNALRVAPYDLGAYEIVDGQTTYALSITPATGGTITKSPNKTSYLENEQVTVTAIPSSGWHFTSWTGAWTGSVNPRTVAMTSNLTVGAAFTVDAPNPPTAFQGSEITPGCANLAWIVSTSPLVNGYRIYHGARSVEAGDASAYTDSITVGAVALAQICDLSAGVRYFNIKTRNSNGDFSPFAGEIMVALDGPDVVAPEIVVGSPSEGEVNVDPRNTTIFFMLSDAGSGVDTSSVSVLIDGLTPARRTFTGDPSGYAVVCEPAGPLPASSTVVVSVTAEDRASPSNSASRQWSFATKSVPPTIPTGLSAFGGNDGCAALSWNSNPEPDNDGYTIYYGPASVASGDAAAYADSMTVGDVAARNICGLTDGTYYFALKARSEEGLYSDYSAEATATVTDITLQGPTPPQQVQVLETTPGCVTVSWDANPETNIAAYVVYYGTQSVAEGEASQYGDSVEVGTATSRQICGFTPGMTYFAVRARNSFGLYSAYSAEKPVDVIGPDLTPPRIVIASPADGASGVPQNTDILFVLSDAHSGVDRNAVTVTVAGQAAASISFIGDPQSYAVVCRTGRVLPSNTPFTVVVRAADLSSAANEATWSWIFRTASSRPSAPTGVVATGNSSGCAALAWDPNPETDLAAYVVYFGTASVENGQASAYEDSMVVGLTPSMAVCGLLDDTYYFAIRAKNVVGVLGALSDEAAAVVTNVDTEGPLPPQQVQVSETSPGCVSAAWQESTSPDVSGYVVYYRMVTSLLGSTGDYADSVDVGASRSRTICDLDPGMYYFAVRAYDTSDLMGEFSTEKWVNVVGRDTSAPKVLVGSPLNGAIEVRPTSNIFFVVSDSQSGVDTASVYVSINGAPPAEVNYAGDASAFAVVCDPGSDLPLNTRVTVQVTVADLAAPPNLARTTWSFTTTTGRPSAPNGVAAQGDDAGCMNVSWNANPEPDVTGYRIYYGRRSVALGDASAYDDSLTVSEITARTVCGLVEDVYYVALRARSDTGTLGGLSAEVSTQVSNGAAQPPLPPQGIAAVEGYPGCIRVSWQRNTEPNIAGYVVYHGSRSVASGDASAYSGSMDVGNKTSEQICGFEKGPYFVAVRAYDATGTFSGFSMEQSVYVLGEDLEDPEIIVASPRNGQNGVALNASILFVIADGQTGVDKNSIVVEINGAAPGAMSVSGDSASYAVVCEPEGGFSPDTPVTVEVSASDLADTPNAASLSWSFTTGSLDDDTAPQLVGQDPAPGATDVDPASVVRLRFSDESGIAIASIDFRVNGETVSDTSLTFHDNGDVTVQYDNESRFAPGSAVTVSVALSDLASNAAEIEFSFTVREEAVLPDNMLARIVPDGYWAHDPSKPLEIKDLPPGWTVRIFDTGGYEVRAYRNGQAQGIDWTWDFENDHGRRVVKSLYLIRVTDETGAVRRSGRFVVRSES
jgi:hypothetical protein